VINNSHIVTSETIYYQVFYFNTVVMFRFNYHNKLIKVTAFTRPS